MRSLLCFLLCSFLCFSSFASGTPTTEWLTKYSSSGALGVNDMFVDPSGNVFVTGWIDKGANGIDYLTIKYDYKGVEQWVKTYNNANGNDTAIAIIIDDTSNVYVTGVSDNGSDYDYVTIKYNAAGTVQWTKSYDGPKHSRDRANAIFKDLDNNIYVTGESTGDESDLDYLTIKYENDGDTAWTRRYDGYADADRAMAIVVDTAGYISVTGMSLNDYGDADYLTIQYNSAGTVQWNTRQKGGYSAAEDIPYAIFTDTEGNVFVTGGSESSSGNTDYFTVKYESDGDTAWTARWDGPSNETDIARSIFVDGSGNVFITGESDSLSNNYDFITIKYTEDGTEDWVARYDGPVSGNDYAKEIFLDQFGDVYVAGYCRGNETYDDYTTIKYTCGGNEAWVAHYNSPSDSTDQAAALFVNNNGQVHVTGYSYCDTGSLAGPNLVTIQYAVPLDTMYWYVEGEKDYWFPQRDVYAFKMSDSSEFTISDDDTSFIASQTFDSDSNHMYNIVYFMESSSYCDRLAVIGNIEELEGYSRSFPAITKIPYAFGREDKWGLALDIILVFFKSGTTTALIDTFENDWGLTSVYTPPESRGLNSTYMFTLNDTTQNSIELAVDIWETDTVIVEVGPGRSGFLESYTNDTYYDQTWHLLNTGQCLGMSTSGTGSAGSDIDVECAWNAGFTGDGINVAVFDVEFFDTNHPDMTSPDRYLDGYNAINDNQDVDAPAGSVQAHGQACAGLIAANANNNEGNVGVAYEANIIPVIVNDEISWVKALIAIDDHPNVPSADIVSGSIGFKDGFSSRFITDEISFNVLWGRGGNGIVHVFSAGNDGRDIQVSPLHQSFPSTLNTVIGVIGSNPNDELKTEGDGWDPDMNDYPSLNGWGSNFGSPLDVAAPGTHVITTDLSGGDGLNDALATDVPEIGDYFYADYCPFRADLDEDYTYFNGSSASVPIVAGICALMLEADPNLSFEDVYIALTESCEDVGNYNYTQSYSNELAHGRVNACNAISEVLDGVAEKTNQPKNLFIVSTLVEQNLYIHYQFNEVEGPINIIIYDVLGHLVHQEVVSQKVGSNSIPMNTDPPGTYFVIVQQAGGAVIQNAKIIKTQ